MDGRASLKEVKKMLDIIPADKAREILDPAAQDTLRRIESVSLEVGEAQVDSSFLGPDPNSPSDQGTHIEKIPRIIETSDDWSLCVIAHQRHKDVGSRLKRLAFSLSRAACVLAHS